MHYLNVLKGMTHHGDEHVYKYDDNRYMVGGEQEHTHTLHNSCRVITPGKQITSHLKLGWNIMYETVVNKQHNMQIFHLIEI